MMDSSMADLDASTVGQQQVRECGRVGVGVWVLVCGLLLTSLDLE